METSRSLRPGLVPALAVVLSLVRCAGTAPSADAGAPFTTVASSHARVTTDAPAADVAELQHANTAFALDLFRAVAPAGVNAVLSPCSVSVALAMTYAGARGGTESQMATALRCTLPQARLHAAFDTLDRDLAARTAA